jgi:hypothetical protein
LFSNGHFVKFVFFGFHLINFGKKSQKFFFHFWTFNKMGVMFLENFLKTFKTEILCFRYWAPFSWKTPL